MALGQQGQTSLVGLRAVSKRNELMQRAAEAYWAKVEATGMAHDFCAKTLVVTAYRDALKIADKIQRENDRLTVALQKIADEAATHAEHNPVSGVDRLPLGYTKIINIARAAAKL